MRRNKDKTREILTQAFSQGKQYSDKKPLHSISLWGVQFKRANILKKFQMLFYKHIWRPIFYVWDREESVYIKRFRL